MRILHTIPGRNWGGMEFRTIEQVAWLNGRGHPSWLATPADGESFRRARDQGLPVIDFQFDHPWRISTIRGLRTLLSDLKIDVADAHVTKDAKALMVCLDLVGVVRSRHITQRLKPDLMRRWQWRLGSDHVIAVAECIRQTMIEDGLIEADRSDVVGEWADESFFASSDPEVRAHRRASWSVGEGDFVIATVSMLRPDKGLEYLIGALAILRDAGLSARLVLTGAATGEGEGYEAFLKAEAARLGLAGRVVFPGYCTDVAAILAAADAVAVPSIANEAQGRITAQALAAGKPVVASRVGGLPELVKDGKTGLLVEPGNAEALAQALRRLIEEDDLAGKVVANGCCFAKAHLRMDQQMDATLAIYAKALERAKRRPYLRKKDA
ncbi:MAG: glycosyltransferase family 4 protein [Alphaproteobacteria bacterium]|nr:glycosyltransferase family 4 protein [Alphaproteobacteria bacterium]